MNEDEALARLADELARCPFHDFLRPEAVAVEADGSAVVVQIANRPDLGLAHDSDIVHGGVLATLVDITAHAAIAVSTGGPMPTVDLRIDYLRPARGPMLVATGRPVQVGRSLGRADVDIRDVDGRLLVVGRGTFHVASTLLKHTGE